MFKISRIGTVRNNMATIISIELKEKVKTGFSILNYNLKIKLYRSIDGSFAEYNVFKFRTILFSPLIFYLIFLFLEKWEQSRINLF